MCSRAFASAAITVARNILKQCSNGLSLRCRREEPVVALFISQEVAIWQSNAARLPLRTPTAFASMATCSIVNFAEFGSYDASSMPQGLRTGTEKDEKIERQGVHAKGGGTFARKDSCWVLGRRSRPSQRTLFQAWEIVWHSQWQQSTTFSKAQNTCKWRHVHRLEQPWKWLGVLGREF